MSLKGCIDVSPEKTTELLDAVEDLQKGKRNAKRKLYKCVKKGYISAEEYCELLDKHYKKKDICIFGYPIREHIFCWYIISLHIAFFILGEAVREDNHWAFFSLFYLGISFGFYFYCNERNKNDANFEVTQLKQEIRKLESYLDSKEETINYLKQKLDSTHQA